MKELRLRVIFQWVDIVDDSISKESVEYLRNWQEVIDFCTENSNSAMSCEVFDLVPDEIPF